jgi:hypothetical protein
MTTSLESRIFNFIRGAIRGINGWEDFSNINFLVVGTDGPGKSLLKWIGQAPGASMYFTNDTFHGLRQYKEALAEDPSVRYLQEGDCVDIVIDNLTQQVRIKNKQFSFSSLQEDAYTQGIHEFYL